MERLICTDSALLSWEKGRCWSALGVSLQGLNHQQGGEALQDSHALRTLPCGWGLAVVCDGVGSEPHADIGARLAAESFADFTQRYWGFYQDEQSVLNLLRCAAMHAMGRLKRQAQADGCPLQEYSTTLHAAVYANGLAYFLHAGDGGILALLESGEYISLTSPMKDEDGERVVPLLAGPEYWQTGASPERVQSLLLCTDGVYDKLAGVILRDYGGVDRGVASFFMSPWAFDCWDEPKKIAQCFQKAFRGGEPNDFYPHIVKAVAQGGDEEAAGAFVVERVYQKNRPLELLQGIGDDITVTLIQGIPAAVQIRPMEDYASPDWEDMNRKVYIRLFGELPRDELSNPDEKSDDDVL